MAHVACKRCPALTTIVLGTGTALDTARLRYLLGEYFSVDPRNVHAYVMGEHGDSEFVPWSRAMVAHKPILDIFHDRGVTDYQKDLDHISEEVRNGPQKIISAKKVHLLWNRNGDGQDYPGNSRRRSQCFDGFLNASREYGNETYTPEPPCIVSRDGVKRTVELTLTPEEREKLHDSVNCRGRIPGHQGV